MLKIELLNFAVENGMLDMDALQGIKMAKEKQEILAKHNFNVWQGKDGRWCTYLPSDSGRKFVKRKNKEDIEKAIVDHYYDVTLVRISDVFDEWIEDKMYYKELTESSYQRYMSDYHRFFKEDNYICQKPFKNITYEDLEMFIKDTILEFQLTEKQYSMLRIIIRGIFRFGKSKNYTDLGIVRFFDELYLSKGIFKKKKKIIDSDEVFSDEEREKLIEYFKKYKTPQHLGLLLQFQTGMRIGEISALKKSDVRDDLIHVCRTEEKLYDKEKGKSYIGVVDFTKTDAGDRYIILPDVAKETIKTIKTYVNNSEYLFVVGDKRITTRMFRTALKNACEKNDIKAKSTHKIRKTYASTLIANNVDETVVKQMLGHSNILTTHSIYNFSTVAKEEKINQINKAITM